MLPHPQIVKAKGRANQSAQVPAGKECMAGNVPDEPSKACIRFRSMRPQHGNFIMIKVQQHP